MKKKTHFVYIFPLGSLLTSCHDSNHISHLFQEIFLHNMRFHHGIKLWLTLSSNLYLPVFFFSCPPLVVIFSGSTFLGACLVMKGFTYIFMRCRKTGHHKKGSTNYLSEKLVILHLFSLNLTPIRLVTSFSSFFLLVLPCRFYFGMACLGYFVFNVLAFFVGTLILFVLCLSGYTHIYNTINTNY